MFPLRVAHALAKAERRGAIQVGEGQQLLADILSSPPHLHAYLPLLAQAFALASAARFGVYDCLYLALADQEHCELITADDRLARAFSNKRIVLLGTMP